MSGPSAKPRLRGVSHELAAYGSAAAGAWLVAQPSRAPEAVAVYAVCLFAMFAASALYHRPQWGPTARAWMRRLDHSAIYLLIAGTSTPVAALCLTGRSAALMLSVLWAGALLGVLKSLFWVNAPKPVAAFAYVLLGLAAAPFLPDFGPALGARGVTLIAGGGALYILGALGYALKRPNPWPRVFGYHEIFHALVIGAAVCHFVAILGLVRSYKLPPLAVDEKGAGLKS